jgi:hypothetical protein
VALPAKTATGRDARRFELPAILLCGSITEC